MLVTYVVVVVLAATQGVSRDSLMAEGIRLAAMQPGEAVLRFDRALQLDSLDLEANWRAAIARSDMALPLVRKADRATRDSLLLSAQVTARRARRLAPNSAQAAFTLGLVLGNTALTKGTREKVRMATEIRALGILATTADSNHDGAQHLLGRWNYEVMKLSGFERFIAKSILGGAAFGQASWEEARRRLERAVSLDPTRIYHRLDLARVLAARKEKTAAVAQLERIAGLPERVAADTTYRREAGELLEKLGQR